MSVRHSHAKHPWDLFQRQKRHCKCLRYVLSFWGSCPVWSETFWSFCFILPPETSVYIFCHYDFTLPMFQSSVFLFLIKGTFFLDMTNGCFGVLSGRGLGREKQYSLWKPKLCALSFLLLRLKCTQTMRCNLNKHFFFCKEEITLWFSTKHISTHNLRLCNMWTLKPFAKLKPELLYVVVAFANQL